MHYPPQRFIVCNETNYIFCKDKCRCAKKGTKPQHLWNRWSQYALEQLPEQMDDPALLPPPDCIFGTPVRPVTLAVPSHISHTCSYTAASLWHAAEVGIRVKGSSFAPRHDAATLGTGRDVEQGQWVPELGRRQAGCRRRAHGHCMQMNGKQHVSK